MHKFKLEINQKYTYNFTHVHTHAHTSMQVKCLMQNYTAKVKEKWQCARSTSMSITTNFRI